MFQSRAAFPLGTIFLVIFIMLLATFAGIATALAGPLAAAIFAGLLGGAVALLLPLSWLVVALFVLSFVVTGQLSYFANMDKALWFPYLVGALLLVRYPLDRMQRNRHSGHDSKSAPGSPVTLRVLIGLFLTTVVASTLINASPPLQVFVSAKEYFFLWGLYLVCAAGLIKPDLVVRIWAWLPWLMVLQLPLIFYQRFVVVPQRIGTASYFDAVVGAFGGNPFGGGASGAMGMFCVIGIATALARWRARLISGWHATVLVSAGLLGIGMAEIKFMVILLPTAFGLLFVRDLARRPIQGLLMIGVGFVLAVGVLLGYKAQYGQQTRGGQTTEEYVERMFQKNTDIDFVDMRTRQIGRAASVAFWYREHDIRDPMRLLLGHGAGASREGALVVGEAQRGYPFQLTRSSIGILLWETGLVGTLLFLAMLGAAYAALFRQSGDSRLPVESRATLASMAVAVAVFAFSVPYDPSIMLDYHLMILLMLCLGYAAMTNRGDNRLGVDAQTARPEDRPAARQAFMRT